VSFFFIWKHGLVDWEKKKLTSCITFKSDCWQIQELCQRADTQGRNQ